MKKDFPLLFLSRVITFIACIWFGSVGYSQVQFSVPNGQKSTEPPKEKADADKRDNGTIQRGTQDAPLVVDIMESKDKKDETAKDQAREDAQLSTNRWMMGFTGVLSVFTFAQIIFYLYHRREDTADYIQENRPWVSYEVTGYNVMPDAYISFSIVFLNHGKTVAKDIGYRAYARLVPFAERYTGALVEPAPWPWDQKVINLFPTSGADQKKLGKTYIQLGEMLTAQEIESITDRHTALVVVLQIEYFDLWEKRHITQSHVVGLAQPPSIGFYIRPGHNVVT